jgi:ribosomal protein L21E
VDNIYVIISVSERTTSMDFPDGDWAIISIDGAITRAKIVHKSRGRYVIVEDSKGGKYVNKVIDAGDIMQVEK